jgi:hypothetical protein
MRRREVFDEALDNGQDVTLSFDRDFGGLVDRLKRTVERDAPTRAAMRRDLLAKGQVLRIEPDESLLLDCRRRLEAGDVAAVDGTDLIPPLFLHTGSMFGCVTAAFDRRQSPEVVKRVTFTQAGGSCWQEELLDSGAVDHGSWPTTFREYQERCLALKLPHPFVWVDGPLFTQNLVTQARGRSLLAGFLSGPAVRAGVVKSLTRSAEALYISRCLRPGEYCVRDEVRSHLARRYAEKMPHVREFVGQLGDFVRVVVRPQRRAFELECRLSELKSVLAMLVADASPVVGHEMPLTLELCDQTLRAMNQSGALARGLIAHCVAFAGDLAEDLLGERECR